MFATSSKIKMEFGNASLGEIAIIGKCKIIDRFPRSVLINLPGIDISVVVVISSTCTFSNRHADLPSGLATRSFYRNLTAARIDACVYSMLACLFIGLRFAIKIHLIARALDRLGARPHISSLYKILKTISRAGLFI